jgi:hypothetical protein
VSADWLDTLTPEERTQWDEFVAHFRRDTLGKIADSAIVMSLVPRSGDFDVKFAVELGAAIMLDKPIIAVALPGTPIPAKLREIADRIVEADIDVEEGRQTFARALDAMMLSQKTIEVGDHVRHHGSGWSGPVTGIAEDPRDGGEGVMPRLVTVRPTSPRPKVYADDRPVGDEWEGWRPITVGEDELEVIRG